MKANEADLRKRSDQGKFWWELRSCAYYPKFANPKIAYNRFQVKPAFAAVKDPIFNNDAVYFIPNPPEWLLGVLNSRLLWFFVMFYCIEIQNGYQLLETSFGDIYIPTPDEKFIEKLSRLDGSIGLDEVTNLCFDAYNLDQEVRDLITSYTAKLDKTIT